MGQQQKNCVVNNPTIPEYLLQVDPTPKTMGISDDLLKIFSLQLLEQVITYQDKLNTLKWLLDNPDKSVEDYVNRK